MYQNIIRRYMNGDFTATMSDSQAAKHLHDYLLYLAKCLQSGDHLNPSKWTSLKLFINRYPGMHTWLSLYMNNELDFEINMLCKDDLMCFIETTLKMAFLDGQRG